MSIPRPERLSQTLLRTADNCPHAAHLYLKHGSSPSLPKHRGTLLHMVEERMLWTLIENGEENLYAAAADEDPLHAKQQVASMTSAIVNEVAAEHPDLPLTAADRDDVREMAYHLAVGYDVSPSRVRALEQKFYMSVGAWTVSGKIDVLATCDDPGVDVQVDDFKTSFLIPSYEDFARTFQTKLYAAFVAFGHPVEREMCPVCEGTAENGCTGCLGKGYAESLGAPIGRDFNTFRIREVYPRYLDDEGKVRYRSLDLTRTELHDFMVDVQALVARVDGYITAGEWPAVPGSHCTMCPASLECPLPPVLRDGLGEIRTAEDAARALTLVSLEERRLAAIKKDAKKFAPVVIGDEVWEVKAQDSTVTDWDGLNAAAAIGPVDIEAFRKKRTSSTFRKRKVKPEDTKEDAA